jgi:hypothetical protein
MTQGGGGDVRRWNVYFEGKYTSTKQGLVPVMSAFPDPGTEDYDEARRRLHLAKSPGVLVEHERNRALGKARGWVVGRNMHTSMEAQARILATQKRLFGWDYKPCEGRPEERAAAALSTAVNPVAAAVYRAVAAGQRVDRAQLLLVTGDLCHRTTVLVCASLACYTYSAVGVDREVIALVAWDLASAKFAMKRNPQLLDTNRVYCKISTLVGQGLLENVCQRVYRPTSEGRATIAALGRRSM